MKKGVEQKALAEYLGVHPQVITEWKGGRKKSYKMRNENAKQKAGVLPPPMYCLCGII